MIVIRDPKTFCFNDDWQKGVDANLKHKIELIIKSNESLAKNKIKNMNKEHSKANKPNKFILNLLQRLDLRTSNKHVDLQNFTWKNIRKQYKRNKLKIIAPT